MIMEVQTLFVVFRSNALRARTIIHHYCRGIDVVAHAAIAASFVFLCSVAIIFYSNHQRCKKLRELLLDLISSEDVRLQHKSARAIQASTRGYLQRRLFLQRHQASILIQSRIRGIIVRSILGGQGLPTLARAVVQEDGVQQRAAATLCAVGVAANTSPSASSVHEDCKNLIAAFHDEESKANIDAMRDESVRLFGTQVKAVMEVRMRLLAAVVLQSWFRMIRCRMGYRRIFSSLNTAPITNMPSLGLPRRQDTQEGLSFISSLSSWSSTWNRRQSSRLGASGSFFVTAASSRTSSFEHTAFRPTKEEKEALKDSIKDYASAYASIVQLQAWWRGSSVRLHHVSSRSMEDLNILSDGALSAPVAVPPVEYSRRKREGPTGSDTEYTIRTSNMSMPSPGQETDERPSRHTRAFGTRRRRRRTNKKYSDLWQNALERVAECQTMCHVGIDSTASTDSHSKKAAEIGRLVCEDPTNYEVILTSIKNELPECSSIHSKCAEASQKHIEAGGCAWFTEDDFVQSARSNAMKVAGHLCTWRKPRRKRGVHRNGGSSVYYVPTDMEPLDVEPLSTTNTACSTAQSMMNVSSYLSMNHTFSSPSPTPHILSSPSSYTFQTYGTDETSNQSSETPKKHKDHQQRRGRMNYGFCSAPVPTSMTSSSESSNSQSSDGESYYSIDDIDVHEFGDEDSYSRYAACPSPPKTKARVGRRYKSFEDDDLSIPSFD